MRHLGLLVVLALAAPALAADRAPSRDGALILINKDVNGERWAITYDSGRQTVTGNVLLPGGGATFIDCDARPQGANDIGMSCWAFDGVSWLFLANVSLPRSFFGLGSNPGGTCSQYPTYMYITYGDNCGVRAEAELDFNDRNGCTAAGEVYGSSDVSIEGAYVTLQIDGADNFTARIEYRGACSGVATGSGRVTSTNTGGQWRAEGQVTGSTTCCPNLSGTFSVHQ